MIWPLAMAQMAAGTAIGMAAAANRALAREMLRGLAEAIEVVEDMAAEARAGPRGELPPAAEAPAILEGRARSGGRALPARPHDLLLLHLGPDRLRLRLRGSAAPGAIDALAQALAAFPGVRRVTGRALTGSVILEAEGSAARLAAALESGGVARLGRPVMLHPAAAMTAFWLARLDGQIRARSGGAEDLRSLTARLIAAAERARGQGARPA